VDIIVKGRHTGVSDRFREHVSSKLARIERLDSKLIRVDVEVCKERNPRLSDQRERVELTIHSRGPAIRAEASAGDRFAALDLALDKLENRLRRIADRRKVHYGNQCPPSVAEITAALGALDEPRNGERNVKVVDDESADAYEDTYAAAVEKEDAERASSFSTSRATASGTSRSSTTSPRTRTRTRTRRPSRRRTPSGRPPRPPRASRSSPSRCRARVRSSSVRNPTRPTR
jgi:ribosomal subunit interface protein